LTDATGERRNRQFRQRFRRLRSCRSNPIWGIRDELADEVVEDALYDSQAMRSFAGKNS
jgi:hypothetical protein